MNIALGTEKFEKKLHFFKNIFAGHVFSIRTGFGFFKKRVDYFKLSNCLYVKGGALASPFMV